MEKTIIELSIDANEKLATGRVLKTTTEFDSYYYKSNFQDDPKRIGNHFSERGFSKVYDAKTIGYSKPNKPYSMSFTGQQSIETIGNRLIVKPFLTFPVSKNPFTQKTRSYPVDFIYKQKKEMTSFLSIPDGYKVTNLPESYSIDNSLVKIVYRAKMMDNQLEFYALSEFKKPKYVPREYARIKSYFNTIVKKFNQEIVLEKIE